MCYVAYFAFSWEWICEYMRVSNTIYSFLVASIIQGQIVFLIVIIIVFYLKAEVVIILVRYMKVGRPDTHIYDK